MTRRQCERSLFERLKECGRDFGNATSVGEKRQNAMAALEAVVEYCRSRHTTIDTQVVLIALFGDIDNLDKGREASFLKLGTRRSKARPERAQHEDIVLAYAVAALDYLIDYGRSPKEAARRVIQEMSSRRLAPPPRQSNSNTGPEQRLLNYRKRLSARRLSPAVTEAYFEAKKAAASLDPDTALKTIFDVAGPLGSKVS